MCLREPGRNDTTGPKYRWQKLQSIRFAGRRCFSGDPVLRHDRLWRHHCAGYLLQEQGPNSIVGSRSSEPAGSWTPPLGRFDFLFNHNFFYVCLDLLIALGVVRDLVLDRRVRKVYRYALPALIAGRSLALYMWRINPHGWRTFTHAILGSCTGELLLGPRQTRLLPAELGPVGLLSVPIHERQN
jgi:hypothetical protein